MTATRFATVAAIRSEASARVCESANFANELGDRKVIDNNIIYVASLSFADSHRSHICHMSSRFLISPPRARKGVRTCEPAFGLASPAACGRTIHPCISVQRCRPEV